MKSLMLKNCQILDPYGELGYVPDGQIVIQDGTITDAGADISSDAPAEDSIDLSGKLVLPGMVNAHTHLYSSLAMGMPGPAQPPANFHETLKKIWWKLDLALDPYSTKASFESGFLECMRHGVTTVIDHHSSQNFIQNSLRMEAEIAKDFGIRLAPAFELTDRNGQDRFLKGLEENINSYTQYNADPEIVPMMGLHASFTLSDESLSAIRSAMKSINNYGIHVHISEDSIDEKDALDRKYTSVLQRLIRFDLINDRSLLIHGIHIPEEDVEVIRKLKAILVHNPTSNANNRVGLLSAETIRSTQAGLGTDGMQCNMLAEAKEGTLIRSSHLSGGSNVDYLKLLFKHNPDIASRLFGYPIGHIAPGYAADLAIYDYHPRTELSSENFGAHLLYGLRIPSDIITAGQFRIRNNQFETIRESEIKDNSKTQSYRLWERFKKH